MSGSQKSTFRNRVRIVLLADVLLSMLITGTVDYLGLPNKPEFSLGAIFKAFFTVPLSWVLFPVNLAILGILAAVLVYHNWKQELREDKIGRNFRHSEETPYGDAHFEEPHEYVDVAQIRPKELCKGKVIGQLTEDGKECIDFNPFNGRTNQHMFVVAMSGGGKTYSFTKPYLFMSCKSRCSILVTDPDGGLYRDTAGFFMDNGYIVRHLSLKDLSVSDGWDCMATLGHGDLLTNVQLFSAACVNNMPCMSNNIYKGASESLLSALILRVWLGHDYPPEKKNIRSVHEILIDPAGDAHLFEMFDPINLTDEELPCLQFFTSAMKGASGPLAGNIVTNLRVGLNSLNNPLLLKILSTNEIDLTEPGLRPCIYYCQFPDLHSTYQFVVSLFFTMMVLSLADYADNHTETGELPVTVNFLLDEFIAIGQIPNWSDMISVIRKRSLNAVMIAQSIPQFKVLYDESWKNILNNCGTIITHGINESDETAKWLSERIGETSIEIESSRRSEILGRKAIVMAQASSGIGRRSLMTPDEICKIDENHGLIIFARHNPIYCRTTPNVIFPEAKLLRKVSDIETIPFEDREKREDLRECEKAYIEKYWQEHQIRPDFHLSDLSDAMYTEEPTGPLQMLFELIADDFKQIWHKLHNGKAHRAAQKGSKEPVSDISDRGESDYLSIKFAEKGAFQAFYEQWLKDHVSSSKEEKDIRQIHGLNVDMKTGEVVNKPKASVEVKKPIHTHFAAQAAGQSAASGKKQTNAAQEEKSNPRYTTVLDEQEVVVSSAKGTRQKKPKENAPEEPATEKKEQKTQNNSGAGREPVKDPEVEEFAPITTAQANPLGTGEPSAVKKKKTMPYVKK